MWRGCSLFNDLSLFFAAAVGSWIEVIRRFVYRHTFHHVRFHSECHFDIRERESGRRGGIRELESDPMRRAWKGMDSENYMSHSVTMNDSKPRTKDMYQ